MRLLIDECVPRPVKAEFSGYGVWTVAEMGWTGKKNGELLELMSDDGFDVLITVDQSIRHQQNLQAMGVSVLVLIAATNRADDLVPLVPAAEAALMTIQTGDVVEITA
jgi:hypothetical protein